MSARVLFVDDEPRVLEGIRRLLHNTFDIEFAEGGRRGLEALDREPFSVIVSDMMMPEINGPRFLAMAAERQPDAVQMILSGQADLTSTVAAVNDGNIFRFLLKPIDCDALASALGAATEQFRLGQVEQEMLEQTLAGAVDALGEILAIASPESSQRADKLRLYVRRIAAATSLQDDWQLNIAAMLANIGSLAVPDDVRERAGSGAPLTREEARMMSRHPTVAADVIVRIPRLDGVAEIVRCQHARDVSGVRAELANHARIVQLATELADAVLRGVPEREAISLIEQTGRYSVQLLAGLRTDPAPTRLAELSSDELRRGMVLRSSLYTPMGVVVAVADTRLTDVLLARIRNFAAGVGLCEPILVEVALGKVMP